MRRKFSWTEKQIDKLNKVKKVLEEFADYKPLTLRQIFYQLVSKEYIENTKSQYGMLSNLLKWARLDGYIPWSDIEDRVRVFHDGSGWDDKDYFINYELRNFLRGYRRDMLRSQNKFIEVWIEKDALSSIFTKVTMDYCISTIVCRGFSSVSFLNDFKNRLLEYPEKNPIMLYFGDFDPSGVEMLDAMKITLRDEMNVKGLKFKRIALLKEDIYKYKLPHNPDALKKTDTRAVKHMKNFGELAVELDALRPDILQGKIKKAIEEELDMEKFRKEKEEEKYELESLKTLKSHVSEFFKGSK
jgi:hypothetical protein